MADIFISYCSADHDLAQALARRLEEAGYDVWWDYRLHGGVSFREAITAELNSSKAALVLWTNDSIASRFVIDEASMAADHNKLIPIRCRGLDANKLPLGFRGLHVIDLDNWANLIASLERLHVYPTRGSASGKLEKPDAEGVKRANEVDKAATQGRRKNKRALSVAAGTGAAGLVLYYLFSKSVGSRELGETGDILGSIFLGLAIVCGLISLVSLTYFWSMRSGR